MKPLTFTGNCHSSGSLMEFDVTANVRTTQNGYSTSEMSTNYWVCQKNASFFGGRIKIEIPTTT